MKNAKQDLRKKLKKLFVQRDDLLAIRDENKLANTVCLVTEKQIKDVEQSIAWTEKELDNFGGPNNAA